MINYYGIIDFSNIKLTVNRFLFYKNFIFCYKLIIKDKNSLFLEVYYKISFI
jgi:hypothetical protein